MKTSIYNTIALMITAMFTCTLLVATRKSRGLSSWLPRNVTSNLVTRTPGPALIALQWRHNERDGVSNNQSHDCLLNRLFRRRSKKTSKLRVTGLCAGNSPVAGEFPAQKTSNAEMFPLDGVIMNGSDQLHEGQCWPNLPHDTGRRLSLLFVLATFPGLERILAWRVTFKSCKIFI